ncbi:TetR/AcrR family transcriptional regulator [Nicoliella spurrieriana]|uniref:TetR/AcrR family transcriptional regulator n=1 Tax=Nicoliella spurrieriana TaxID=2925830 RepID=A0A976RT94_9LACO|nr:TetR/AcrR family transcriptional regulator [Nicoliella spurrieriana]UQS87416.1 TetR/AcrR family transcriptional regulator [Nicoliella spurrieriana]
MTTKSKTKIVNAFLSLINQKSILDITNIDIINEADVSKGTFYHHFHSKNEIIRYSEEQIDQQIVHAFIKEYRRENKPELTPEVFVDIFSKTAIPIVYQNRDQIRILHGSDVNEIWRHYLEIHYFRIMRRVYPDDDTFHIRLFIKYVNLVVSLWISALIPMDEAEFQKRFKELLESKLLINKK